MAGISHFVSEIKSSLGWIVPLSFATTFVLGRWPFVHAEYEGAKPPAWRSQCSQRRATAIRKARERSTEKAEEPGQSVFMKLPTEVRLSILELCAPGPVDRRGTNSTKTFLALLRVSKTIQYETYIACLPVIPIALWTKRGVLSFHSFLRRKPEFGCLVRHLWIGTGRYDEEELAWAVDILRSATRLRSLACTEILLCKAAKEGRLAVSCERLTLMNTEKQANYEAKGVTQLRLCTGSLSNRTKFPNVTNLSVNIRRRNNGRDEKLLEETVAAEKWLDVFEKLSAVGLVGRDFQELSPQVELRPRARMIRRDRKPDMFCVMIPAKWTEWDIWSADVWGGGIRDYCRIPSSK